MNQTSDGAGSARRRMLALVAGAEIFGMSAWFSASAVSPRLREIWSLDLGAGLPGGEPAGVGDSAQFSTLVSELAPRHAVGTALTLQTSLGFLLTLATIQIVPRLAEATSWRWAFAVLALGPAFGIAAIQRLARSRRARRPAG